MNSNMRIGKDGLMEAICYVEFQIRYEKILAIFIERIKDRCVEGYRNVSAVKA